jgi:hypothetical protein
MEMMMLKSWIARVACIAVAALAFAPVALVTVQQAAHIVA